MNCFNRWTIHSMFSCKGLVPIVCYRVVSKQATLSKLMDKYFVMCKLFGTNNIIIVTDDYVDNVDSDFYRCIANVDHVANETVSLTNDPMDESQVYSTLSKDMLIRCESFIHNTAHGHGIVMDSTAMILISADNGRQYYRFDIESLFSPGPNSFRIFGLYKYCDIRMKDENNVNSIGNIMEDPFLSARERILYKFSKLLLLNPEVMAMLGGSKQYTLFVPADCYDVTEFKYPTDKSMCIAYLLSHIVSGNITRNVIKSSSVDSTTLSTCNGCRISISKKHGTINDQSRMIHCDMMFSNGVIHVIDRMLQNKSTISSFTTPNRSLVNRGNLFSELMLHSYSKDINDFNMKVSIEKLMIINTTVNDIIVPLFREISTLSADNEANKLTRLSTEIFGSLTNDVVTYNNPNKSRSLSESEINSYNLRQTKLISDYNDKVNCLMSVVSQASSLLYDVECMSHNLTAIRSRIKL